MLPIPYALDALNFLSADVRNLLGPFINVFIPETLPQQAIACDSELAAIEGAPGE
jgi:hypothetical protein